MRAGEDVGATEMRLKLYRRAVCVVCLAVVIAFPSFPFFRSFFFQPLARRRYRRTPLSPLVPRCANGFGELHFLRPHCTSAGYYPVLSSVKHQFHRIRAVPSTRAKCRAQTKHPPLESIHTLTPIHRNPLKVGPVLLSAFRSTAVSMPTHRAGSACICAISSV